MYLNSGLFPQGATVDEAQAHIDQHNEYMADKVGAAPLPMRPLYRNSAGCWSLWCPNLDQKTGRCSDYQNRPETCRVFEPASAPLCILHVPLWEDLNGQASDA
jgi:Fe-S-cluster containining protein